MPHVTIFGLHYAPEPAGNAPYTTGLAEFLAASGWAVDVITGYPHYPGWHRQQAASRSTDNGVCVTRRGHYVPTSPTTLGRGMMEATWLMNASPRALRKLDTDIVIGVVPTLSGAALATIAAHRAGVPCVVWIQDLMGHAAQQSGVKGGQRVARIVEAMEHSLFRRSDAALIVAQGFQGYLADGGMPGDRIYLTPNWSLLPDPQRSREEARSYFGFDDSNGVVVHSGNMGSKQGLGVVLEVAAEMPGVTFVLQGDGSERPDLETRASSLSNVFFLPLLSGEDLANLLHCADVLLLTQRPSVTNMSMPSKLTSYLSSGTPIVASVNDKSEAAVFLRDVGSAVCVPAGDIQGLSASIRAVLERPVAVRDPQLPRSAIPLNRATGPSKIEEILRTLIAHGAKHSRDAVP